MYNKSFSVLIVTVLMDLFISACNGKWLSCSGKLAKITHSDCQRLVTPDVCFFVPHFAQYKSCAVICNAVELGATGYERCNAYCSAFITSSCRIVSAYPSPTTVTVTSVATPTPTTPTPTTTVPNIVNPTVSEKRDPGNNDNADDRNTLIHLYIAGSIAAAATLMCVIVLVAFVLHKKSSHKCNARSNKPAYSPGTFNKGQYPIGVEETEAHCEDEEGPMKPSQQYEHVKLYQPDTVSECSTVVAVEYSGDEKAENLLNDKLSAV